MFRNKDLCPGPRECPEVLNLEEQTDRWTAPCPECPRQLLHDYLASPFGLLISIAIDFDFAIQAGITVRLSDIPYPEYLLLKQCQEERAKFEAEMIKKPRQENR